MIYNLLYSRFLIRLDRSFQNVVHVQASYMYRALFRMRRRLAYQVPHFDREWVVGGLGDGGQKEIFLA